ncbi:response regulator [Pseudoduganella namucuonensis]|uniref:Two-component system, OmpR family, response regulator BaeR n=1 Tax=Pseudoduganella namucuonensis TaxID=1035707 RepID=A0A1I7JRF4_9BURK|nr:response regulator [Pseudoduganella namucuonensis]SFU87736.1 two-component system, OmpR family, response regulator BaeR [Pseudoduganella namucuonensis]
MENAAHILIVEDDPKIAAVLADYMAAAGYRVTRVADGAHAVETLRAEPADLMLLDLNLPGLDGLEVCKRARGFSQLPIIMLTARVDEIDRLLGLDAGADDYVCKPFSPREVVARVRAQLRRASGMLAPASAPLFQVDRERMRILLAGAVLTLTPVEFRLLAELIEHPDRVYSRQQLLDVAHEDQRDISDRTVDSHIKNIRRKLAARPAAADCLQSVYGVGYRFELAFC